MLLRQNFGKLKRGQVIFKWYIIFPIKQKWQAGIKFKRHMSKLDVFLWVSVKWTPYSVWIRENADQNNSEYEHLLRSIAGR